MTGFYLKEMLGFLPHKGQIFELFQGGGSNQGLSEKKYPGFAYKTIKKYNPSMPSHNNQPDTFHTLKNFLLLGNL
jgi:hypothetical protein